MRISINVVFLGVALFAAVGCAEGGSYRSQPYGYPSSGYPDRYDRHDRYDDYDRYDRNDDRDDHRHHHQHDDNRYDYQYGDDRHHDGHHHQHDDRHENYPPPPPRNAPKPAPAEHVIRPNCPSGTRYDGRSCVIEDQRLKKKGGDGRINPCPKGMWVSGDRCVGN